MAKHNLGQGRKVNTECIRQTTHTVKKSIKRVEASRRTNNTGFIDQMFGEKLK